MVVMLCVWSCGGGCGGCGGTDFFVECGGDEAVEPFVKCRLK